MHTCMLPPEEWAAAEFGGAALGDIRRSARLLKVAGAMARCGYGTLPGVIPGWSELKGAYRLLGNEQVDASEVLAPHLLRTRQSCDRLQRVLLIEDTTSLNYSLHLATSGLGRIGDDGGRGLFLHTTLAVSFPESRILGVFAHNCWVRPDRTDGGSSKTESTRRRRTRERESQRWGVCLTQGVPLAEGRYTFVADREADIYDLFWRCRGAKVQFVIRAYNDRALEEESRHFLQACREAPRRGTTHVSLRARPGQKAREAKLEIRSRKLVLRPPANRPISEKPDPLPVNVLLVKEMDAPAGVEPIEWILLTDWAIDTLKDCQGVVAVYEQRWLVEEYHKCLKSGCEVEKSQLESARGLMRLIAIAAVVSVRLLDRKLLARREPQGRSIPQDLGSSALAVLEARYGRPTGGWTNQQTVRHIAMLGGFLGRTGDGEPGWITIWRGYGRLQLMIDGYDMGAEYG